MLKFISNLFRKTESTPLALLTHGSSHFSGEAPAIVPTVEIAHLSLAAILAKFPADLRGCVQNLPDDAATVTLPVPTIIKQLPTCSVKMSLASLYRQAPPGVFKPGPPEDKRMVEVPLAEIFKRVRPELLKRRQDQRPSAVPADGYNLFGDKENPRAVALTLPEAPEQEPAKPETIIDFGPTITAQQPSDEAEPIEKTPITPVTPTAPLAPPADLAASVAPTPALKMPVPAPVPAPATAPAAAPAPKPVPAPVAVKKEGPPLVLPIGELAANWPELIRAEVGTMNGATVSLPNSEVTAGLAKGRVLFHWGQLRDWITPPPPGASGADADTELSLPLRIVAPAFLKASKGTTEARQRASFGEDIPTLFRGNEATPAAPAPALCVIPEEAPAAARIEPEPESEPVVLPKAAVPAAPVAETLAQTLGEIFSQPGKTSWSPTEIVENVTKLAGVSGAIVAMQEGLVVAHRLPDQMNGETFAAFMPQIFARLNKYAGEMSLGAINAVTLHTQGAPCQMFQHGEILFAALGNAGEALPAHALHLCADTFKK